MICSQVRPLTLAMFATILALSGSATPVGSRCPSGPPAFFLAGDSTTAVQGPSGGGWGTGFLSYLNETAGAWGENHGINGATTASYVEAGEWARVLSAARHAAAAGYTPIVTIQFGHNDQQPSRGVSRGQFRDNLQRMASEARHAGAQPVVLSPLTRRDFWPGNGSLVDSLRDERVLARRAAVAAAARFLDLNRASAAYVQAIGPDAAARYDSRPGDSTHLGPRGSVVFGRIVADLLLGHGPRLHRPGLVLQSPGNAAWPARVGRHGGAGDDGDDEDNSDNADDGLEPRPECMRNWILTDEKMSRKIWRGKAA